MGPVNGYLKNLKSVSDVKHGKNKATQGDYSDPSLKGFCLERDHPSRKDKFLAASTVIAYDAPSPQRTHL